MEKEYPTIEIAALEANEAGRKAAMVCRSLDELKGLDITLLDVQGQTIISDYFVICTGTSTTHIQSLAGHVRDNMREGGLRARPEGDALSAWVVLDYGDVIVHVLGEETREFYDLERLWADAKISHWPEEQSSS